MSEEDVIPEWAKEGLPEQLHAVPFLKDTENLDSFVTKLGEAAQHMGNSMRIPGPDAGTEDWKAFDEKLGAKVPGLIRANLESEEGRAQLMTMLGRPEDAAGYGAEGDGAWLADVALKAGLTKSQFEGLVQGVGDKNVVRKEEVTAEQAQAMDDLKTEWGLSYAKKMEHIEGLTKLTKAPEAFAEQLKDGKVDAETLRWMDTIAGQFAAAANFKDDSNSPDSITPAEATSQIQELMKNENYFQNNAIGEQLRKKMVELQAAASPGAQRNMEHLRADSNMLELFGN